MSNDSSAALPSWEQAAVRLASPGSPFELVDEQVLGQPMKVFKNRAPSLRAALMSAEQFGDAEYMVFDGGGRWTYAELLRDVGSVATALRDEYGIGKGDTVAILAANSPEWVLTFWATVSLGGVVVAMNGWWAADEIRHGLDISEPKLLVADARRLERLEGKPSGARQLVIEDDFAKLLAHAPGAPLPDAQVEEDDPAVLLFTSGTTGRPKAPLLSHRAILNFVTTSFWIGAMRSMTEPKVGGPPGALLAPFPLFHVSGLFGTTISALVGGQKTVWPTGRFDPVRVIALTNREEVTNWNGATTHIFRLLNHSDMDSVDKKRFTNVGASGSATSPELVRLIHEHFPHLSQSVGTGYGLTESGALISYAPGAMLKAAANCVGPAVPTVEVKVVDEDGNEVAEGEVGAICARSPMVMLNYFKNPEATDGTFLPGRWLDTGDFGRLRNGSLFMESRMRDMIIRGGENIFPIEIENRLEEHPDVMDVAVFGIDHPELGQEVKAVVVPHQGATLDGEALRKFVGDSLAYFKVPAVVEVRDEPLPRNATGKVLKHVVSGDAENSFVEE